MLQDYADMGDGEEDPAGAAQNAKRLRDDVDKMHLRIMLYEEDKP